MGRIVVGLAASVAFLVMSSPAVSQTAGQPASPQPTAKKVPDPNEVICEKEQDSSSRLASKRVCMTRSQWAEQRRLDRQDVEKAQTQVPINAPQ